MTGRLSTLAAALVVARRDFTAILFSRSFIFFLLGPLFPVVVAAMAGGVGQHVEKTASVPTLGIAMSEADNQRFVTARRSLADFGGIALPEVAVLRDARDGESVDARSLLGGQSGGVQAVLAGSVARPSLTGPPDLIDAWRGPVSMIAAQAQGQGPRAYPQVALAPVRHAEMTDRHGRVMTAQGGQMMLFLLTMLLAGMVLSNLVEEKGNKIIEVLAAAIPMDAVFLGKLFAMLGVSLVAVAVWTVSGGAFALVASSALPDIAAPAVGWPLFLILGVIYFSMAYLLLGSIFLAIGSMATTVREVQTLSMPATMMQLVVFFLASYAMTAPGSPVELFAVSFPLSSPFAMVARAAQDGAVWPHLLAIGWQALWVALSVRAGAALFRKRVMKSGPQGARRQRRRFFARKAAAPA